MCDFYYAALRAEIRLAQQPQNYFVGWQVKAGQMHRQALELSKDGVVWARHADEHEQSSLARVSTVHPWSRCKFLTQTRVQYN